MLTKTICISCGRITQKITGFCQYCHSPLGDLFKPPPASHGLLIAHCDGGIFRIPRDKLSHIAFYGQTFLGKTHHAMHIAKELEAAGVTVAVVDRVGTWMRLIPDLDRESVYYHASTNLRINPFDLGDRGLVKLLLKETIFKGVEYEYADVSPQMNFVLDQCVNASESIPQLIDKIIHYKGSLPFRLTNLNATKTALLVRLEPYRSNPVLRDIFYCEKSSIDLESLCRKARNVFIDLHDLHRLVAYKKEIMLVYNFFASAYLRNALSREETTRVEHAFIIDEAQLLVPKIFRKVTAADTWTTTDFAAELMKRGVILVIITQFPSSIEADIRKNIHHNFIYRLQDAEEIRLIAGLFGYTHYDQVSYFGAVLSGLEKRQSIVRTPLWGQPFLVRSPELVLKPIEEVAKQVGPARIGPDYSEDEKLFLASIKTNPYLPMTVRREELGFDKQRYAGVVNGLLAKDVIEKVHVRQSAGRPIVLYQRKGARPGVEHEYYVGWLVKQLKLKGFSVEKRDHRDIVVQGEKTVVIEYETGTSDLLQNITAGLGIADLVISTSVDDTVLNRIRKLLERNKIDMQRVKVTKVWEVPQLVDRLFRRKG